MQEKIKYIESLKKKTKKEPKEMDLITFLKG